MPPLACKTLNVFRKAFSLIEVIIAIGILSIAMGGLFTGLVLSSNEAIQDLYDQVAHNAAQSYLNQLISLPNQGWFLGVVNAPTSALFATYSMQNNNGHMTWTLDPLAINGLNVLPNDGNQLINQPLSSNNQKTVFFRYDPKNPDEIINLDLKFTLYIGELTQNTPPVKGYSIVLVADYSVPSFRGLVDRSVTVAGIKNFN